MTALKLGLAVGFFLGAGTLAWAADPFARAEAMASFKKAAAFIKREAAAFAKFIGTDGSDEQELEEQPVLAAKQSEPWQDSKVPGVVGRLF